MTDRAKSTGRYVCFIDTGYRNWSVLCVVRARGCTRVSSREETRVETRVTPSISLCFTQSDSLVNGLAGCFTETDVGAFVYVRGIIPRGQGIAMISGCLGLFASPLASESHCTFHLSTSPCRSFYDTRFCCSVLSYTAPTKLHEALLSLYLWTLSTRPAFTSGGVSSPHRRSSTYCHSVSPKFHVYRTINCFWPFSPCFTASTLRTLFKEIVWLRKRD